MYHILKPRILWGTLVGWARKPHARLQGCFVCFYFSSFPYCYYLDTDSVSLDLIPFYFTRVHHIFCSGINPLTHSSSSSPCFVRFTSSRRRVPFRPPVAIKSCSWEVVQSISAYEKQPTFAFSSSRPLTFSSREAQYTLTRSKFTFTPTVHTLRPTPLTLSSYRSTDSVQRLSQTTAEVLTPPFAQHTTLENPTFDSQADGSFY